MANMPSEFPSIASRLSPTSSTSGTANWWWWSTAEDHIFGTANRSNTLPNPAKSRGKPKERVAVTQSSGKVIEKKSSYFRSLAILPTKKKTGRRLFEKEQKQLLPKCLRKLLRGKNIKESAASNPTDSNSALIIKAAEEAPSCKKSQKSKRMTPGKVGLTGRKPSKELNEVALHSTGTAKPKLDFQLRKALKPLHNFPKVDLWLTYVVYRVHLWWPPSSVQLAATRSVQQ